MSKSDIERAARVCEERAERAGCRGCEHATAKSLAAKIRALAPDPVAEAERRLGWEAFSEDIADEVMCHGDIMDDEGNYLQCRDTTDDLAKMCAGCRFNEAWYALRRALLREVTP